MREVGVTKPGRTTSTHPLLVIPMKKSQCKVEYNVMSQLVADDPKTEPTHYGCFLPATIAAETSETPPRALGGGT